MPKLNRKRVSTAIQAAPAPATDRDEETFGNINADARRRRRGTRFKSRGVSTAFQGSPLLG